MAIKEQGFGEGVNLAQRGLSQLRQIGQTIEKTGSFVQQQLDQDQIDKLTLDIRKNVGDFGDKTLNRPVEEALQTDFDGQFESYKESVLGSARNGKVRKALEKELEFMNVQYSTKIANKKNNYLEAKAKAETVDIVNSNTDKIGMLSSQGLTEESGALYQETVTKIEQSNLTPSEKSLKINQINTTLRLTKGKSFVNNLYDNIDGQIESGNPDITEKELVEQTEAVIKALDNPEIHKEDLAKIGLNVQNGIIYDSTTNTPYSIDDIGKIQRMVAQRGSSSVNKFNTLNQQKIISKDRDLKTLESMQTSGVVVKEEVYEAFLERNANILTENDKQNIEIMREASSLLDNASHFERSKVIKETYKESPYEAAVLQKISDVARGNELDDPVLYYQRNNKLDQKAFTFEDGIEESLAFLSERDMTLDKLSKENKVPYTLLSKGEANAFSGMYDSLTIADREIFLTNLTNNIGSEKVNKLAEQVFGQDGSSQFVRDINFSGKLKESNLNLMFNGRNIIANNPDLYKDKKVKDEITSVFSELAEGKYDDITSSFRLPQDREATLELYTALMAKDGKVGSDFDEDIYEEAFNTIYGQTVEVNTGFFGGGKTINTPNNEISGDQMLENLENLTPSTMTLINNPTMPIETIKTMLDNEQLNLAPVQIEGTTDYVYELHDAHGNPIASDELDENGRPVSYKLPLSDIYDSGVQFQKASVFQQVNVNKLQSYEDYKKQTEVDENKILDVYNTKGIEAVKQLPEIKDFVKATGISAEDLLLQGKKIEDVEPDFLDTSVLFLNNKIKNFKKSFGETIDFTEKVIKQAFTETLPEQKVTVQDQVKELVNDLKETRATIILDPEHAKAVQAEIENKKRLLKEKIQFEKNRYNNSGINLFGTFEQKFLDEGLNEEIQKLLGAN